MICESKNEWIWKDALKIIVTWLVSTFKRSGLTVIFLDFRSLPVFILWVQICCLDKMKLILVVSVGTLLVFGGKDSWKTLCKSLTFPTFQQGVSIISWHHRIKQFSYLSGIYFVEIKQGTKSMCVSGGTLLVFSRNTLNRGSGNLYHFGVSSVILELSKLSSFLIWVNFSSNMDQSTGDCSMHFFFMVEIVLKRVDAKCYLFHFQARCAVSYFEV